VRNQCGNSVLRRWGLVFGFFWDILSLYCSRGRGYLYEKGKVQERIERANENDCERLSTIGCLVGNRSQTIRDLFTKRLGGLHE